MALFRSVQVTVAYISQCCAVMETTDPVDGELDVPAVWLTRLRSKESDWIGDT